jgi:DUF971 family protein
MPWPTELRFRKSKGLLRVTFDDEAVFDIPYKRLREESPSAEVRGHGSGPRPPQPPVPDDVGVTQADPVGRYAVRIYFTDGHSSGLYTWKHLREIAEMPGTAKDSLN